LYYRGAHAAAVVYDITSPDTFEKAKYWIGELKRNASGSIGEVCCRHHHHQQHQTSS
jgi:GTPase SAR1 family protein